MEIKVKETAIAQQKQEMIGRRSASAGRFPFV